MDIIGRIVSESEAADEAIGFAETDRIAPFGDISSDFFRLLGVGDVCFISNDSRLTNIMSATAPELSVEDMYARIWEIYKVDVTGLDLLIDISNESKAARSIALGLGNGEDRSRKWGDCRRSAFVHRLDLDRAFGTALLPDAAGASSATWRSTTVAISLRERVGTS